MHTLHKTPLLATLAASALLSACGGSDTPAPVTGVFLDSAVQGLDYTVGGNATTTTNSKGEFTCSGTETLSFTMGGLALGSAPCASTITPLSLASGSGVTSDPVVNRLLTLQLLDEDRDPANGIQLATPVKAALNGRSLDFGANATAFNAALNTTMAALPAPYSSRVADDSRRALAREHFENTLASTVGTPFIETVTQTHRLGTVSASVTRYTVQAPSALYIPYEGSVQAIKDAFPQGFLPAYGSGLALKGKLADGTLEFYALTDRGPNGDGPKVPNTGAALCFTRSDASCDAKLFPASSFAPAIGVISVGKDGAVLKTSTPIRISAALLGNGRPAGLNKLGASGEVPLSDNLKYDASSKATFSTDGLDPEALVVDTARNALWVADEYGPFIVKIDAATGTVLKKYGPAITAGSSVTAAADVSPVLPSVLAKRRANRGMEGLALDLASGRLHGFLQSPVTDLSASGAFATGTYVAPGGSGCVDAGSSKRVERYARFTRWVEFDPSTETSRMFAYPIACADYKDNRTGNAKLGDMVSLGGGKFIVIEQGAGPDGKVFNRLMLVDTSGATDIAAAAFNPSSSDLEKSSMAGVAVNGVADYLTSVTPLKKTLLLDLNAAGWLAEKAEGLTLVDATTLALANDNDFGLRTIVFDSAGVEVADADITACTSTDGVLSGCGKGISARVGRGSDAERPNRLWLIKFGKNLADFSVPASAP
ncbi:MAG: esterase-like activity of phytase family protein [Rhodoferax sp.]|nr:esterase-like activity of phytase family protein [Rhodoferax sp.]